MCLRGLQAPYRTTSWGYSSYRTHVNCFLVDISEEGSLDSINGINRKFKYKVKTSVRAQHFPFCLFWTFRLHSLFVTKVTDVKTQSSFVSIQRPHVKELFYECSFLRIRPRNWNTALDFINDAQYHISTKWSQIILTSVGPDHQKLSNLVLPSWPFLSASSTCMKPLFHPEIFVSFQFQICRMVEMSHSHSLAAKFPIWGLLAGGVQRNPLRRLGSHKHPLRVISGKYSDVSARRKAALVLCSQ